MILMGSTRMIGNFLPDCGGLWTDNELLQSFQGGFKRLGENDNDPFIGRKLYSEDDFRDFINMTACMDIHSALYDRMKP